MNRLGDIRFLSLLPESIRDDEQLAAAAESIDGLLRRTTAAIPNLLLFARLERDRKAFLPPLARLIEAAGGLKQLSPELLELLAWQLHVDFREVAKTPEQLEGMVRRSIPWHRIKGTPSSVKDALTLFGLSAEIEEDGVDDYWATYQIGLPQIADVETVKLVCKIAYEMHPARCSLYRIYTDVWDVRPGTYSDGRYSEAAYSFYSGVPVPGLPDGGDLIVSFGRKHAAQSLPVLSTMYAGRLRTRGAVALPEDDMQYSAAVYSASILPVNHGFVRSRLRSIVVGKPVYRHHTWSGAWDERKWADLENIGYTRESTAFVRKSVAAVEAVYGESAYSGADGFYAQPVFQMVDNPPVYSDAAYSEHDPQRHTIVVDEMFERKHCAQSLDLLLPWDAQGGAKLTRKGEHQAQTEPLLPRPAAWNGKWNGRSWRAGGAFSNIIHTEVV